MPPHHCGSTPVHHTQRMITRQVRNVLDDGRPGYRFATTPARPARAKMRSQGTGSQAETIIIVQELININSYEYH